MCVSADLSPEETELSTGHRGLRHCPAILTYKRPVVTRAEYQQHPMTPVPTRQPQLQRVHWNKQWKIMDMLISKA